MPVVVTALDQNATRILPEFSQLVAIRWDLLQWGVVLELNCWDLPDGDGDACRGWLAFDGVSDISWTLQNSRLPHGVIITSPIDQQEMECGFAKFSIFHLAPTFNEREEVAGNPHNALIIVAKALLGFRSKATMKAKNDWLDYQERNTLATDADFLAALNRG